MHSITTWSDRMAIGLSSACMLHCLLLPMVLLIYPSITSSFIASETTHLVLLFSTLPISLLALITGCRKHRNFRIVAIGMIGLSILSWTAFFGHDFFERMHWEAFGETLFTMAGALLMVLAHFRNLQLCRKDSHCCS